MIGQLVTFKKYADNRGQLIALESLSDCIDFEIKRVYYIFDTASGVVRGLHAHKTLKQILICTSGSCKVKLDNGKDTEVYNLDYPDKGLIISGCVWRELYDFSSNAVLMVLASEHYNENEYIRSYDEFLKYLKDYEQKKH